MVTSEYSMGKVPSALSMVSSTWARPSADRPVVPAKITSSILPPRRFLAPCSPMTHDNASTTFDLPEPFGPITDVMPGSKSNVVFDAKDLNPRIVSIFRYMPERYATNDRCHDRHQRRPSALQRLKVPLWQKPYEHQLFHHRRGSQQQPWPHIQHHQLIV